MRLPLTFIFYQVFLLLSFYPHLSEQTCVATAGFYCPRSDGDPIRCTKGYYCLGGENSAMTPCPVNTYNPNDGGDKADACLMCEKRRVTSGVAFTACHFCPAGTSYSDNGGTAAPFAGQCTACAAGTSSVENSDTCSSCLVGHYSDASTCSICRPGTYQDIPGASSCQACPDGTYTYTSNTSETGARIFSALWGAVSSSQCINLPTFGAPLVCLPGTYMIMGNCQPCPIGYYCPTMQIVEGDPSAVRICPAGKITTQRGGITASDCTRNSLLRPYVFDNCKIAEGETQVLDPLTVTSSVTSKSSGTLYFTTATAVYRVLLLRSSSTLEIVAGNEGIAAVNGAVTNAVGMDARFSDLTAIAVDFDLNEATMIVVGDGNAVRMVNVFTKQVTLLGKKGDVAVVGGIALQKDALGAIKAYVSDTTGNRIMVFDLQNMQSNRLAGNPGGLAGAMDGSFSFASFRSPKGLAFLERNHNAARMLLVADSGNGRIRVIDTQTREVKTWFSAMDRITPELSAPSAISVAAESSSTPLIYVVDAGQVKVIQFPISSDSTLKVITPITVASGMGITFQNAIPYGSLVTFNDGIVGFKSLIAHNSVTKKISAFVEQGSSGNAATCFLPCERTNGVCGALETAQLCGNSFLDTDAATGYEEQCDNGGADSGGCVKNECTIKPGYTCPKPLTKCLNPCPAFTYAPDSSKHCAQDCLKLKPRDGYTIDSECKEHDIDECALGTAKCGPLALCTNTVGSYTCTCSSTYFGDGVNCVDNAFAVYSVVDLPATYPSSLFINALSDPTAQASKTVLDSLEVIKRRYATTLTTFLPDSMMVVAGFNMTTAQLAVQHTYVSVDPVFKLRTRLELVSLFPSLQIAQEAAAKTESSKALSDALTLAFFGNTNSVISVFQQPKTRKHNTYSFSAPNFIEGWGMNITGVNYNRTCAVAGVAPRGGCWQVEMIYVGGQQLPSANENPAVTMPQSKNVLYLPRIEHDPTTLQPLNPSQALTESSGIFFPCSTLSSSSSGLGVTREATACCFRDFNAIYRPHAGFANFLASPDFVNGAPSDVCDAQATFNDTYPSSNLVYSHAGGEGETNDLVVGKLDGMPNSEVRLLETIDYTTRTFKVLLVLEEGDLMRHASTIQGSPGLEYSMTFFVGLANFKGTGGSVVNSRNVQQFITVTKSNMLTISTYGTNQNPLVDYSDMKLVRIKVNDFFNPVKYLYYLRPMFTLSNRFKAMASGAGIVPLDSIRVVKSQDNPSATDARWVQACGSSDGNFIYANADLQQLVRRAQSSTCINNYLQICAPPQQVSQLVTFGIPLAQDSITEEDLKANPSYSLRAQFVVQAFDIERKSNVITSLSMAVDLSPLGMQLQCESVTASQSMADIVNGNIYVGTATNDFEWDNTLMQKTNMDVPGTGPPSNNFEFRTVTVQQSVMTFTALGDPRYFLDSRATSQSLNINDIYSINFLEPLGGKGGSSPTYDRVRALFLEGKAFNLRKDTANQVAWLEPSEALLAMCPYRPRTGLMVCITRVHSTISNNVLKRNTKDVVEIRPGNAASETEMKEIMGHVLFQGGGNSFSDTLATNFTNQLVKRLDLNSRFRKAYVINPLVDWSFQAMQAAQPRSTAYTVCTKIIAIGLITINSGNGAVLGRRLLSSAMDLQPPPSAPAMHSQVSLSNPNLHSGRALLQVSPEASLAPTQSQSSNSLVLEMDIPGYSSVTHLCNIILGVDYDKCNVLQFQSLITGKTASDLCMAKSQGVLGDVLTNSYKNLLLDPYGLSQISGMYILNFDLFGCVEEEEEAVPGQRRLLESNDHNKNLVVSFESNTLVSSYNGTTILSADSMRALSSWLNSTVFTNIVSGGGFVTALEVKIVPDPSGGLGKIQVIVNVGNNSNLNKTLIQESLKSVKNINNLDIMFDNGNNRVKASSAHTAHSFSILLINTVTLLSISALFSGMVL